MESSEEDEDISSHIGIIPQWNIKSVHQSESEKGIRKLCWELLELKDSVETLCQSRNTNTNTNTASKYLPFLRLSEEVVEMEHELGELRKHISAQGILIQDLQTGVFPEWIETGDQDEDDLSCKDVNMNTTYTFLENIDILLLLSQHNFLDAVAAFDVEENNSPAKSILEDHLLQITAHPSLSHFELNQALSALLKLGKGPLAHQILLKRYAFRLHKRVEAFLPFSSLYPQTYPATLSKIIFSFISLAAKQSHSTFGDDPVYTNKVVQWAEEEIESFVRLLKEHAPSSDTINALRAAAICVQASLKNCIILQGQGVNFSKLLMVLLKPYMEEVLEMNFRRARRLLLDITQNDQTLPLSPRFLSPLSIFASSSDHVLISSGLKFIYIVKEIVEQLTPLAIVQFGGNILGRIVQIFHNYVDLLTKALPSPSEDDVITELKESLPFKAETDSQQLALLGVANSVVDDLLPMAVSTIWNVKLDTHDPTIGSHEGISPIGSSAVEFKDWRRQLQHSLDKLRDHFCRQYVLNFIYSREGKTRLEARIYVDGGDDFLWSSDPLPSLPFQALFARLQQLATVAGDVLLGKEKLQKVLLARLTETIVMWLSAEQEFWGVFEDESVPLKPFGLQQLILDMHFTVEIARFAGYPSRQVLQLASGIIARAVKTFSARGIDPQSTLPEDEWFSEAAKAAINKLLLVVSGSEASDTEEVGYLHQQSDSEDSISCPSTADSFHSFVSAETDLDSPSHMIDPVEYA